MRRFERTLGITATTRVLDVGGTPFNWSLAAVMPKVTLVNMPRAQDHPEQNSFTRVSADGRRLPFADRSFDVVFSNSVIEHVGTQEDQQRFAAEIARVGKRYWVQTPNRWFPVELHLLTPFVHYLPRRWQARIVPRFSVWAWLEKPSPDRLAFLVDHYLHDIRLLDAVRLQQYFPEARLIRERFLGITKSLIALRQS